MNRRLTYALATAATAATLTLTGCGGTDSGAAPQSPASSQPSASSTESTTAPSAETSPSGAASPSAESSASEPSGDQGGKPAKSEIVAGLAAFYEKTQGISAAKSKKFATCMVDEMYDKAKTATLVAMRDGEPTKIDKADVGLLTQSGVTCQPALA